MDVYEANERAEPETLDVKLFIYLSIYLYCPDSDEGTCDCGRGPLSDHSYDSI